MKDLSLRTVNSKECHTNKSYEWSTQNTVQTSDYHNTTDIKYLADI